VTFYFKHAFFPDNILWGQKLPWS